MRLSESAVLVGDASTGNSGPIPRGRPRAGPDTPISLFQYVTPNARQIPGLLAVLAVAVMFSGQGAFVGWSVVTGVFKVFGVVGTVPFTWLAYGVWVVAVPCAVASWRRDWRHDLEPAAVATVWRTLILASEVRSAL